MNRLAQKYVKHLPMSFRLVIGSVSKDPAFPDNKRWASPYDLRTGKYDPDVVELYYLDFVAGYHAVELNPQIRFWNRYGWIERPYPSDHGRREPFINLYNRFTEDEILGFMMQCMVRRTDVYREQIPTRSESALPGYGDGPRPTVKDIMGERLD